MTDGCRADLEEEAPEVDSEGAAGPHLDEETGSGRLVDSEVAPRRRGGMGSRRCRRTRMSARQ